MRDRFAANLKQFKLTLFIYRTHAESNWRNVNQQQQQKRPNLNKARATAKFKKKKKNKKSTHTHIGAETNLTHARTRTQFAKNKTGSCDGREKNIGRKSREIQM